MNIEEFRDYCLQKPGVSESLPFDDTTLVFKVAGKMFALTDTQDDFSVNLKCDPGKSVELREKYPSVVPGYHMNKKHWITVMMDGTVPVESLRKWIDDSYDLVVSKLSQRDKALLSGL
ncbi:MAG: MmcQ/YjbR family DNA-binding protein [Bacteroidales bacterium]|nr:MmcQ/YjbR family DNA-binding protein [Bacteroidales bacterium]